MLSRSLLLPALGALCALAASGCTSYRTQVVRVTAAADALPPAPEGPLAFEDAVRLLVARHPELAATRAAVAAVNLRPGPRPLVGSMQVRDGDVTETLLRTDVLALLGLGPRRAEIALARAVRDERVRRHHERARDLVADLAEAYAVEHVLAGLPPVGGDFEIEAFERAGLASASLQAAARSVGEEARAERRVIEARRRDSRREIARLVGAAPGWTVQTTGVAAGWPAVPAADRDRLVLARGDLQRLLAAWRVADRRFRYHVARQQPNLVVGLGRNVDLRAPMQLLQIELPLDAPAEARAAMRARTVAFHELEAGVLAALHEAAGGALEVEATQARLAAARERRRAARILLEAEQAHLETDPSGLERVVLVAGRLVDAARQHREAAVAAARARVRAARAAGWPAADRVKGDA